MRNTPSIPILQLGHPLAHRLQGAWVGYEHAGAILYDFVKLFDLDTVGAGLTWVDGDGGRGWDGNGTAYWSAGAATIPEFLNFSTNVDFSIVAGVQMPAAGADRTMVSKQEAPGGTFGKGYSMRVLADGSVYWQIEDVDGLANAAQSSVGQCDGAFHVWAGIRQYNNQILCRDGVATWTTSPCTLKNTGTTSPFFIGRLAHYDLIYADPVYFVYVYRRALSISEVSQIYPDPYQMFRQRNNGMLFATPLAATKIYHVGWPSIGLRVR